MTSSTSPDPAARDQETGLDYFGARYYDAWVGRFLEQDPELGGPTAGSTFEQIAGDSQNVNSFAYVQNRPTRMIDPTGREAIFAGFRVTYNDGSTMTLLTTGSSGSQRKGLDSSTVSCTFA